MSILNALHTGDWSQYNEAGESNEQLEPLELRSIEQDIVIARMKKLAKDPSVDPSNALDLVHMSYQEQEWERQSTVGDITRPTPADRKAWEQYEKFIQLAVQLLSKYRGIDGAWRSNRYDTIPTNSRSSMASMAAASVKESITVKWDSAKDLNLVMESFDSHDHTFGIDGVLDGTIDMAIERIVNDIVDRNMVALEEYVDESTYVIHAHNAQTAEKIDTVTITMG